MNRRHGWAGKVTGASETFRSTFNNAYSWEGGGQFDRSYGRSTHGGEIFLIGRGDTTVRTMRP